MLAFQDHYPENVAHCYGCGRLNEHGHQIKTFWEGDETVTRYHPRPEHTAIPGFVYGGLIASLIDCHSTGTAAAAAYRAENRPMDSEPPLRFVTGSGFCPYSEKAVAGTTLRCSTPSHLRQWGLAVLRILVTPVSGASRDFRYSMGVGMPQVSAANSRPPPMLRTTGAGRSG